MGGGGFGYRPYRGARTGLPARVLAIASGDVRRFFKKKATLLFFIVCVAPAIVTLVMFYVRFVVMEGQAEVAGLSGFRGLSGRGQRLFRDLFDPALMFFTPFLSYATPLAVLFSAVVGARAVSADRRSGALELCFTRGIDPIHYFTGKWLGVTFLIACQLLFSFLAVWLVAVFLAPDWGYFERTVPFVPGWLAGMGFFCAALGFLATAQSAATDSPRFAEIRWIGGLLFLYGAARLLYTHLDESWVFVFSPWHDLRRVAEAIAGVEGVRGFDLGLALVGTAVLLAAGALLVRRSMRPVEVVG